LKVTQTCFDELADQYDAWFDGEGELIFATETKAFNETLLLLPKPWLEVGVGSGRFAQSLGIGLGLDPSLQLLKTAKRRSLDVLRGNGEFAPFASGVFGTVFLIVTLCFVDAPLELLCETDRILKNNGKVVLGLVLRESPWGQFYLERKDKGHPFYQHARLYSYVEVMGLLEYAGFSIEKTVSTLFQKPGEVRRIERPKVGFSANAGFTVIVAKKTDPTTNW
jgi:SAM-dependent methyltransferase